MPAHKHERFGAFDGFMRGMFGVGCLFLNVVVAGEIWRATRDSAPGPGGAAAAAVFIGLALVELVFYLRYWHDVRIEVTEANVKPTIIAEEGDLVQIEMILHNPSMMDARGLGVEARVDGESAGREIVDIAKDSVKSVTATWTGKKGRHALEVLAEAGAGTGKRHKGIVVFEGEFAVRVGKRPEPRPAEPSDLQER